MSSIKIFLVGLPGSGKSTLGKQLADRLASLFIDLDDVIESETDQSIRETFAQYGEDYFRKVEKKALQNVINQTSDFVLATGGGAPCFFDNMARMNQAGTTIFVDTPIPIIAERIQQEGVEVRPLLHELDAKNFTEAYYQKFAHRLPFYQQAKISVTSDNSFELLLDQLKF